MSKKARNTTSQRSGNNPPAALENVIQLVTLYKKNKPIIDAFYQLNNSYQAAELRRQAIGGNTFRAFHRVNSAVGQGMSYYFTNTIERFITENPTSMDVQRRMIEEIGSQADGNFRNWSFDENGRAKLLKLFHLYANYWVANNLEGNLEQKMNFVRLLRVPLDKFSLTFIRNLYNESNTIPDFYLPTNPRMGSIQNMEHYESINSFIDELAKEVNALLDDKSKEFCPIFLDIIHATENNLTWYSDHI